MSLLVDMIAIPSVKVICPSQRILYSMESTFQAVLQLNNSCALTNLLMIIITVPKPNQNALDPTLLVFQLFLLQSYLNKKKTIFLGRCRILFVIRGVLPYEQMGRQRGH